MHNAMGEVADADIVRIRLSRLSLHRPRQWGACWLTVQLWEQLRLDQFWAARLPPNRKSTRWDWVLQILAAYRLLDPGSEWRLCRHWFEHSAMGDLLGADLELAEIHKLHECHERLSFLAGFSAFGFPSRSSAHLLLAASEMARRPAADIFLLPLGLPGPRLIGAAPPSPAMESSWDCRSSICCLIAIMLLSWAVVKFDIFMLMV
jgi:hypothetical protein